MQPTIERIINQARDEARRLLHQGNKYALYEKYRARVIRSLAQNAVAERDDALSQLRNIFLISGGK